MLTEISCSLFKTANNPSDTVKFHKGLNIVLGGSRGETSIGKSTTLLIIDFAFGGLTYAHSDAVRELQDHTIKFVFEFGGKEYHFSRSTKRPELVTYHQSPTSKKDISNKEFCNWLAEQYHIKYENESFRNIISRFSEFMVKITIL